MSATQTPHGPRQVAFLDTADGVRSGANPGAGVRELDALVALEPAQWFLVRGHAGLVINTPPLAASAAEIPQDLHQIASLHVFKLPEFLKFWRPKARAVPGGAQALRAARHQGRTFGIRETRSNECAQNVAFQGLPRDKYTPIVDTRTISTVRSAARGVIKG